MTDSLGLSFYKLLETYPLYDHRIEQENADAVLPVVLVGRGASLELLRNKVLSNGQLLKTRLQVTVISNEPEADMEHLKHQAPDLYRFIRIQGPVDFPEPEWDLGTLIYEYQDLKDSSYRSILERHMDCTYFLFSEDCQELAVSFPAAKSRVVACIQRLRDRESPSLLLCRPKLAELSCEPDDSYLENIRSIAYNLHYAYMKGSDPHVTTRYIRASFLDPYNYESNIECAVHIRSKLRCCGIDNLYTRAAARHFEELLAADRDGALIEELSRLEHQRWCISKLVKGYRLPPDLSLLFSAHDSSRSNLLWHACLVPYQVSRGLQESDWIADNPEHLADLDALDRQTLQLHKAYGQTLGDAEVRIVEFLARLRAFDTLADARHAQSASQSELRLHKHIQELETAVTLLRQSNADARYLYNRSVLALEDQLRRMDGATAGELRHLLAELGRQIKLWIEYITRKDFKEQNRILIRQIPFALSKFQDLTLVKLLSDKTEDCVSAAWQLEPSRIIFVELADSVADLVHIWQLSRQVDRFLRDCCNNVQSEYHIFASGDLTNMRLEYPEFFDKFDCIIHPVASSDTNQVRPEFVELMGACNADYIDMTGGKPELVSIADGYARNSQVGAFTIRSDRLCNFYGADALHGKLLDKGLSVRDVFTQFGAEVVKSGGERLAGRIENDYDALWRISRRHAAHWHGFCMKFLTKVREAAKADAKKQEWNPLLLPGRHIATRLDALRKKQPENHLDAALPGACEQILCELVSARLILKEGEDLLVTSNELMAALVNSGKVLEYFLFFTAQTKCIFHDVVMSYQFKHSDADDAVENELDVICTKDIRTLFISAKNVSAEKSESTAFLKHVCYEVDALASRFGINPKRALAAPNARQFVNGKLSKAAKYCMERGVYLLGAECCDSSVLGTVLDNIMAEKEDWCGFLLEQTAEPA